MTSKSEPLENNKRPPAIVTQPDEPQQSPHPSPIPSSTLPPPSEERVQVDMRADDQTTTPHNDPNNPFAFTPLQLSALMDPKNMDLLHAYSGLEGMARGLQADIQNGLPPSSTIQYKVTLEAVMAKQQERKPFSSSTANNFELRSTVFGTNTLPPIKSKNILELMLLAFRDKTLMFLGIAAIVSLAIGLYEDIAIPEYDGHGNRIPGVKWVEGVAIIVAIVIVVLVGSISDFQKEKQFRKLNAKKEDRLVKATRDGVVSMISVHDVQVGDVLHLEPGDIVSADGILIQGHNLKCDESAATGESDAVRKLPWDTCYRMAYGMKKDKEEEEEKFLTIPVASTTPPSKPPTPQALNNRSLPDPFIISGSKVLEGMATYLVTGVGVNSYHGRTMMALRTEDDMTPLQKKLNELAGMIAKLGFAAAILMLIALLIRYFVAFRNGVPTEPTQIASDVMSILILVVTVIVMAVPEGLPLAVTLALAYATQRMLKDNNLVRVLASCETMGNATTVCSDKTGTLTENKMTVVCGMLGTDFRFTRDDLPDIPQKVPKSVLDLLNQSVAINSSAFEGADDNGQPVLVGNKTETALLSFSRDMGSEHFESLRRRYSVAQLYPFSSERKAMATVVRMGEQSTYYRAHIKGASEIVVGLCSEVVTMGGCETRKMTYEDRRYVESVIEEYASRSLRTIAIAYRDLERWPLLNQAGGDDVPYETLVQDKNLKLVANVGIEDPLRAGVKDAVRACQQAGVFVRMVTGDNVMTAKSIAKQCGIYTPGGVVMEGPVFRRLPPSEMDALIPRLQVLARSSPEDKRILVERLNQLGETVAVTGDGTNDGPALKLADVGFSMGMAGTEVAKEASSIILMDDNFASIVKAILWGRCVNDSVRKFLEFQLTVNVTAVVLTFISGVASSKQKSVLTAVQLLWVNLIMDTFAALALATYPPTEELLERAPEPKSTPLITLKMWKMIIGQSMFQIIVTFVLLYGKVLDYDPGDTVLQTIVFNTFVFCQIFNEINCRRIDSKLNVFHNVLSNKFFIFVFFLCVLLQAIIVNFGCIAFQVTRIDGPSWAIAVVVGLFALPVGAVVRLIPDHWFSFLFRNPDTRRRYLGDKHQGPLVPSVDISSSDIESPCPHQTNQCLKRPTV